jgi:hypothetical protein
MHLTDIRVQKVDQPFGQQLFLEKGLAGGGRNIRANALGNGGEEVMPGLVIQNRSNSFGPAVPSLRRD